MDASRPSAECQQWGETGRSIAGASDRARGRVQLRPRFYLGKLVDISQGGAKVQLRRPLQASGEAILTLPDLGWLESSVRWSVGSTVGLAFNERVPFEMLVRWIQERRKGTRAQGVADPQDLIGRA